MAEGVTQAAEALEAGHKIGHYEIIGKLGQGGMGAVYKARDTRLERLVALKMLSAEKLADEKNRLRFIQEARSASALNHPNIVTIYEIAFVHGERYIAMEYIEGQTLRAVVGRAPNVPSLIPIFRQIAEAMAAAHASGIVHRDIKADNIMLRDDGYIKILDFGLARLSPANDPEDETRTDLTEPGIVMGTAKYMSPEQVLGEPVESSSDVFSMGLMFYELATGRHPFQWGRGRGHLRAILPESPIPASKLNPEVPAGLDALILKMLAREKARRPTCAAVKAALATMEGPASGTPVTAPLSAPIKSVGREEELRRLGAVFASVSAGTGMMLTVAGEAGMGKTTLAEDFLATIEAQYAAAWIGRGPCSERLAETDAFVPIFETLDRLLRAESGDLVARVMRMTAPTWYLQVAPTTAESTEVPPKQALTASHERMRREFVSFFEELSRIRPVVLFLDDLHWADESTCDLLAYLGARIRNIRILILMTYRPAAVLARQHPFLPLKLELERRGISQDVPLSFLSLNDIERYIIMQFPANLFPEEFTRVVQERTEGNPLFMIDMLRFLRNRQILVEQDGRWRLLEPIGEVRKLIPVGIRTMIRLKVEQLKDEDRHILLCAAVQGMQFDSAVIAQVLSRAPADVEERLQQLETVYDFVRMVSERQFPDHTFSVRYRFVHVFYQNALYASLAPSRRASHSLAVARTLIKLTGEMSRAIGADLALLFESGRDYASASQYFLYAARNAARVFAYPETAILCDRGLRALASLPESRERDAQELRFSLTLGMSLMVTRGYAAVEVKERHRRSRELCLKLNDNRRLLSVLWGLHTCDVNGGDLVRALDVAREMRQLAEASADPIDMVESLHALGTTLAFMGRLAEARDALEQIFATYPVGKHVFHGSLYVMDPCVTSLSMWARLLAYMGYLDQASDRAIESVQLANRLAHPPSLAYATFWVGYIHRMRGEYAEACQNLESAMALSRQHGLSQILEWGRMVRGSALARMGRATEGISEIRESLDHQDAMRSFLERSFCLTLLAEALGSQGAYEEALALCDEALEFAQRTEGRCYEPETHRVRGEMLLSVGDDDRLPEAEAEFHCALEQARRTQCRLLEMRAAMSYMRQRRRMGDAAGGRVVLAEIVGWFTEGVNSPALREARNMLGE